MPEANPNPAENRRTPEGGLGLNPLYQNLESKLHDKHAADLADKFSAEVRAGRVSMEVAEHSLPPLMREWDTKIRKLLLELQQINPENIVAAADEERRRGRLGNQAMYQAVLNASYQIIAEVPDTARESREQQTAEMAYRLKTGNLNANLQEFQQKNQENALLNPPPSEALKNATDWWMTGREALLDAYTNKGRLAKEIGLLKKEIKEAAMREKLEVVSKKQGELDWLENQLSAIDIAGMQARLKQLQEHLKVRLMDEFRDDKGAFIRANFENVFRNKRPGATLPASAAEKEQAIKAILEEEVKDRLKGVISDSIYVFDDGLNRERERRIVEFQERTRVQKLLEAWNNMPLYKRLAISAVIAGGVGAFALPMLPVVGGLFTVKGGLAATFAYRGVRSAVGGSAAFIANKFAQWLGRDSYKKEKGKLREERISSSGTAMDRELANAQNWLEDEAMKLRLANIADHFVDEQHKAAEKINKKEADRRRLLAITTGLAAGAWAGLALDAATGGDIFGAPKRAKGWFGKWFGGEEVPPSAGKGAPPSKIAVAPPGAKISGLADAPGSIDTYPDKSYVEGYGDQPAGAGKGGVLEAAGVSDTIKAVKGDTVWEMSRSDFKTRYPGFSDLTPQQQDNVLQRFIFEKHSVHDFGLNDFHKMPIGHELDFKKLTEGMDMNDLIERARGLKGGGGMVPETTTSRPSMVPEPEARTGGRPSIIPEPEGPSGRPSIVPQPEEGVPSTQGRVGTPEPTPGGKTPDVSGGELPERTGGGRTLDVEPEPGSGATETGIQTAAPETSFGSKLEQAIAETGAGFSAEEYKLLRGVTVDQLLKQIPEGGTEQADMWRNFSAGKSWPDLPHTKSIILGISDYKSAELLKQVSLADAIYRLEPNQAARNLTIEQFINQFGNRLEIKRSLLSRFGI